MERRLISISLNEGILVPTEAWVTNVPGLLISQSTDSHKVIEGRYVVTHEPSGQKLVNWEFESLEATVVYVERIADLMDYTQTGNEFYAAARKLAAELWAVASEINDTLRTNPKAILFDAAVITEGEDGSA